MKEILLDMFGLQNSLIKLRSTERRAMDSWNRNQNDASDVRHGCFFSLSASKSRGEVLLERQIEDYVLRGTTVTELFNCQCALEGRNMGESVRDSETCDFRTHTCTISSFIIEMIWG